jgi:hypothetical protein
VHVYTEADSERRHHADRHEHHHFAFKRTAPSKS